MDSYTTKDKYVVKEQPVYKSLILHYLSSYLVNVLINPQLYPVPRKRIRRFFRITSVSRNVETKGKGFWK